MAEKGPGPSEVLKESRERMASKVDDLEKKTNKALNKKKLDDVTRTVKKCAAPVTKRAILGLFIKGRSRIRRKTDPLMALF